MIVVNHATTMRSHGSIFVGCKACHPKWAFTRDTTQTRGALGDSEEELSVCEPVLDLDRR